jgi:hypothetical protein
VALVGLEGRIVEVEADIGAGLPRTVLVGLPDSALYQARDRCKAAVSNSGQEWPISLLTINLSPATLPKAGSHYDLAIVAAILAAQRIFRADELRRTVLLGELGLDGRLRPVRGVLPATLAAQQAGFTRILCLCGRPGRRSWSLGSMCSVLPRLASWSPSYETSRCRWSIRLSPWATRPASTRNAGSTWQTWPVRWRLSGLVRWLLPVGITCFSTARRVSAKRCLPSVFRVSFEVVKFPV